MSAFSLLAGLIIGEVWSPYVSAPDHFKVQFPGAVEVQSQDTSDGTLKMTTKIFRSKTPSKLLCLISVTNIPAGASEADRKKLYDGMIMGFLQRKTLQKVAERDAKFGENSGRYVKLNQGKLEGAIWLVIKKDQLFTLVAANGIGNSTAVESKFFSSFKVTK